MPSDTAILPAVPRTRSPSSDTVVVAGRLRHADADEGGPMVPSMRIAPGALDAGAVR